MNGIQNGKTSNHEKPFPGCLGKMVNLFDLSSGMPGSRLLTEKPYRDGSPLSRSCSDVSRMSPVQDRIEDKAIISELRRTSSNNKTNRTPMKMLIAEQMSKEVVSTENPPNVVAKLMGLDALPPQQPHSASQRCHLRSFSHSDVSLDYWQPEHHSMETLEPPEIRQYPEQNDCKDIYEIWQSHNSRVKDKSSPRERCSGSATEKKMALVREKFSDLKRLATDEKLRKSKKYQDALEVLSSNKELFLKFLQEPNSMFSQHLFDIPSIPAHSDTKRITVLRPAKRVDSEKSVGSQQQLYMKKISQSEQVSKDKRTGFSTPTNCKVEDTRIQTTRIVVLKPTHGKPHDVKPVISPCSSLPSALSMEDHHGECEDDDAPESREVAKEITRQMRENLVENRRDETLLSSMFSNGYIGDESSFHKSENEYAVENICDPELMSPSSRHSWEYINRTEIPYSLSSFSRASYSPESSVCREAKKRLSERWAMMVSNGSCQEKRHTRRSSSTLGEMLAISDMTKSPRPEEVSSHRQEARGSTSCLISSSNDKDNYSDTPSNLPRSKSVPVSSTIYGSRLDLKDLHPKMERTETTKEVTKARSVKSSLKGKVSSLFFSRNKRSGKDDSSRSSPVTEAGMPPSEKDSDIVLSNIASSPDLFVEHKQAQFSVTKSLENINSNDNREQPSPVSVLEPSFDEEDHGIPVFYNNLKPDETGPSSLLTRSNQIDKSPPIGSIARTLSWNESCTETATPYLFKSIRLPIGAEEEKQEWFLLVQTLLSAAGIDNEVRSDALFPRWHSLESPIDPSLRENYTDLNDRETQHDVNQRRRRSTQKLVFDCVNSVLIDLAEYGLATCQKGISCRNFLDRLQDYLSSTIVDTVWNKINEWLSGEARCVFGDFEDNSLVLERLVSNEVVGKRWTEDLTIEIEDFGEEIEKKLLEELVQETIEEFAGVL